MKKNIYTSGGTCPVLERPQNGAACKKENNQVWIHQYVLVNYLSLRQLTCTLRNMIVLTMVTTGLGKRVLKVTAKSPS